MTPLRSTHSDESATPKDACRRCGARSQHYTHPVLRCIMSSRGDLLDQASYADAISRRIDGSVSRSWVSKATKNGKTVADHFRPDLDAVFEGDQLVGYRPPQDRSGGTGNPDSGPTSGNGAGGQERAPRGQSPQRTAAGGARGLPGVDKMAGEVGEAINKSPTFRRGALRFGGAAGGFLLVGLLSGDSENLGAAAVGAAIGFGIAEYSIQAESQSPTSPTKKLRPSTENGQK